MESNFPWSSSSSCLAGWLFFLVLVNAALAAPPEVAFERMGTVALAGAFAGLDLFSNSSTNFDPSTSTLLSRSAQGTLSALGSTNSGGQILTGCALNGVYYLAGSFSSIAGVSVDNLASFDPSSNVFSSLGSSGPNGVVNALFCDTKENKIWVGGKFSSPGAAVAVWDPNASSWSSAPFGGLSGSGGEVLSIVTNASDSSIFFAGSFTVAFGGNISVVLNNTNNPNVPYSPGASPFSSSLVPIPLQNADIDASPSSTDPDFSNIDNILCPSGPDGPGDTWYAADGNTAVINVRTFSAITSNGVRLGNTFISGHGTTGFTVTTIPDNTVQTLSYFDPGTNENQTCSNPCPLSTDSTIPYQDFLFPSTLNITGVQIQLTEWTGAAPGLHLLQLLSSGAFAYANNNQNAQSCYAPNPSNTSFTGDWIVKEANTAIAGTTEEVLAATVPVGTPAAEGPTFTWIPYVSASGQYDVNILVPGCGDLEDCPMRTSVSVIVFPGDGLEPWVSTISQQNEDDTVQLVYSGPIVPSGPNYVTTITMTLADDPTGSGQGGVYELVAGSVELVLTSANVTSSPSSGNTNVTVGGYNGWGFLEWPLGSNANVTATQTMSNSTITALDSIAFDLFNSLGGAANLTSTSANAISDIAFDSSGTVILGGTFTLTSGSAAGASNIVMYKDGQLSSLSNGGLNGPVTSLIIEGSSLFVGGSFTDTSQGSTSGKLGGVAMYDIESNVWTALRAGVNGAVSSLSFINNTVTVAGDFSAVLTSPGDTSSLEAGGFASWNVNQGEWVNSGGFLVGNMTFVGNGTTPGKGQEQGEILAGNVQASLAYGSSGLVFLQNNGSGGPQVTPLGVQLGSDISPVSLVQRRSHVRRGPVAWIPHITRMFKRQSSTGQLVSLPPSPPAIAPAVLAGVFWTNTSSSKQVLIMGGNFSYSPPTGAEVQALAIYDPSTSAITGLQGTQINGTIRALLVVEELLYIGGEFTIAGTNANGLAIYDLVHQQWDFSSLPPLQAGSGSSVTVRSITISAAQTNTIIIGGSFTQAGSLGCQAICSWNTQLGQWNILGSGIQGEISSIAYAGDDESTLVASGSLALSNNAPTNVLEYFFGNSSWMAIGSSGELPGPVTAVTVNAGNGSSIFAAGRSDDGSSSFLAFWNGISWSEIGSDLGPATNISQLTMVPLENQHAMNAIVESDRMLMITGSLADSSFGTVSTALFDGQNIIPYIVSVSMSGQPGIISSLISSITSFNFTQQHFLATGVVILISIAIAAGVVFLLVLIGILWTLFSRREDKLNKFDKDDVDGDDDSALHRPSSLLEHINAATRSTILGVHSPFNNATEEKEDTVAGAAGSSTAHEHDGNGPDASNYVRAETPSDAFGGGLASEETSRPAHARYSFDALEEGELPLVAGQEVEVLDDRDSAWWYARDIRTGKEGVVPAAYLY